MSTCKYSIVPKPKKTLTCSRCGEKIEDLPYYSQVAKLYTCLQKKGDVSHYVGLGLGAPMCDKCDEYVDETIDKTHRRYKYLGWGLAILALLALESLDSSLSGGVFVILMLCVLVFGGVSIMMDRNKHTATNEKFRNSGLDVVKTPFDYLKQHGWGQRIDGQQKCRDYTAGSLRQDLDRICSDGKFLVLDNNTGCFVDYQDPETLMKIYNGSIWVYKPNG